MTGIGCMSGEDSTRNAHPCARESAQPGGDVTVDLFGYFLQGTPEMGSRAGLVVRVWRRRYHIQYKFCWNMDH